MEESYYYIICMVVVLCCLLLLQLLYCPFSSSSKKDIVLLYYCFYDYIIISYCSPFAYIQLGLIAVGREFKNKRRIFLYVSLSAPFFTSFSNLVIYDKLLFRILDSSCSCSNPTFNRFFSFD